MAQAGTRRKLAAIMSADVVGYSRLMAADEAATLATLQSYREIIGRLVVRHDGRVVNAPGDAVLAEFPSAVEAVQAAVEIQQSIEGRNVELAAGRQMHFRIGVNLGNVIEETDGTIYGDGVNIAARMEALAEAGGICISSTIYDAVEGKLGFGFDFLGEQQVKNIPKPVKVYRVRAEARPTLAPRRRWINPRALAAAAALALAILGLATWLYADLTATAPVGESQSIAAPDSRPSIAVLPFANFSDNPEQEYFSDGITEDLITALAQNPGLFVIARNSSFRYKGQPVDVRKVGRELGVRHVVEGSVRRAGDRLRITAQLINVASGGHLWAARYDRDLADVLVLQDEVSQQIAKALQVELRPDLPKQIERQRTGNVEAFDLLLRAKAEKNKATKDANAQARALLEQAIALDPAFSEAYAELSYVLFRDWFYAWAGDAKMLERARDAAESAVALDPRSGLARARFAWIALWSGDHRRALAEVEQAVALEPNSADVLAARAAVLGFAGELTSALDSAKQALRLDPHDYLILLYSGIAQFAAGHLDDAVMSFTETASRNPDFLAAHFFLAASYAQLGRLDEARAEAAIVHRMSSGQPSQLDQSPFQDPLIKEQFLDGLGKAGLEAQAPVNAGTN